MGQRGEAMNSRAHRPLPRNKIVSRRLRNLLWMGLGLALFSLAVRYLDDNLYGSSSFSGWFLTASIVVLAAVITPSGDPITLIALTVPLVLLYFVAIGVGHLIVRRRV